MLVYAFGYWAMSPTPLRISLGLKGKREGDAGVSEKHSLVLVNYGNATGKDILAMAEKVKAAVKRRYGVTLEPEPVIL